MLCTLLLLVEARGPFLWRQPHLATLTPSPRLTLCSVCVCQSRIAIFALIIFFSDFFSVFAIRIMISTTNVIRFNYVSMLATALGFLFAPKEIYDAFGSTSPNYLSSEAMLCSKWYTVSSMPHNSNSVLRFHHSTNFTLLADRLATGMPKHAFWSHSFWWQLLRRITNPRKRWKLILFHFCVVFWSKTKFQILPNVRSFIPPIFT